MSKFWNICTPLPKKCLEWCTTLYQPYQKKEEKKMLKKSSPFPTPKMPLIPREHLLREGCYLIEISVLLFLTDSLISSGFSESWPTSLWPTGNFHLWKDFYFLKYYNDKHKGKWVTAFKKRQFLSLGCDNTRTRFIRRALVFLTWS